jgi:threonyl-tRNA synthetase
MCNQNLNHQAWGEKLELFHFAEHSSGVCFWHPLGWELFQKLVRIWRDDCKKYNWQEVSSPVLSGCYLWEKSGHLDKFKQNMFLINDEIGLKPMSCPGHAEIFKAKSRSYQDLPLRFSELGYVHRNEPSGSLNGLLRARGFHQDDGHVFCEEKDVAQQVHNCLNMALDIYKVFNLECRAELSGKPKDAFGDDAQWDKSKAELSKVLDNSNVKWKFMPGQGAFYGMKIDLLVKDHLDREWQVGSIQLDYVLPKRLNLFYRGVDNKLHHPVMIHRAAYGSLERFIAILLEHWQGDIPLQFAMRPVAILPINKEAIDYAKQLQSKLLEAEIVSSGSLGKRIARLESQGVAQLWIVGKNEIEQAQVSRQQRGQDLGIIDSDKAIELIKQQLSI